MNSAAVAYADIFDYPLTEEEMHHWFIPTGFDPAVKGDSFAPAKVSPYWNFLPGRSHLIALRRQRQHFSQLKWQKLRQLKWIFLLIPWIKLMAVTGALSMNNSGRDDDIDLMIITAKNRLWLSRLLLIILLFPWLRRGHKINNRLCLNLWLDETSLLVKSQNLYTAHEICQAKPLFVRDNMYQQFISANLWFKKFLPNWTSEPSKEKGHSLTGDPAEGRVGTAKPEGVTLLDRLNSLSFNLQYSYMKFKITTEKVSRHFAFFHPRPTAEIILKEYQNRLKQGLFRPQGRSLTGDLAEGQVGTAKPEGATLTDKVVLVTGCFDVLHSEHRKFLTAAKALGGQLLVGLETDARARQLKGPGRPINSLNIRLANLRQLRIADQVFSLPKQFSRPEDYRKFIEKTRPDILAVSASTPFLVNKRQLMESIGGQVVVVLPHNPHISTTLLTNKERNSII